MTTSFTPGPWEVENRGQFMRVISQENRSVSIAETGLWHEEHLPESRANARLIAAAPELLEALIALHAVAFAEQDSDYGAMTKAAAAIFKATGA